MATWWHVLKSTARFGPAVVQRVWDEERALGVVSAGYGNEPDGPGRDKLARYSRGDLILLYAPRFGAVGVAEASGDLPSYQPQQSGHEHAHRRAVRWLATISDICDAVSPALIRDTGAYIPRTLATQLTEPGASRVISLIKSRAAES